MTDEINRINNRTDRRSEKAERDKTGEIYEINRTKKIGSREQTVRTRKDESEKIRQNMIL